MILLVVDTQKGITDNRLYEFDKIKCNIKRLIQTARESGCEIIYVQHDDGPRIGFSKGDEAYEIYEEFEPKLYQSIRMQRLIMNIFQKKWLMIIITDSCGLKDMRNASLWKMPWKY